MADNTANSLYRKQQGIAPITQSYEPVVVDWIKKAAAATGADPTVLLATAIQESGARLHPSAGDGGTSFGTFQFHRGGALANHPPEWASTYPSFLNRAQQFARYKVHHGKGAAAVQGPLDAGLYAKGVDGYMAQAAAILAKNGLTPPGKTRDRVAPKNNLNHDPTGDDLLAQLATTRIQGLLDSNAKLAGISAPLLRMPTPSPRASTVPSTTPAPTTVPKATPVGTPGGGWGGSRNLAQAMAAIGQRNGLSIASEKRSRRNTTSGNMSDHYQGNKTAYAYDLSNGSAPTPQMDATAAQIAAALGVKGWKGGVLNVNRGGYRYQVLYRTKVGGNHFNHVHVGVRKL